MRKHSKKEGRAPEYLYLFLVEVWSVEDIPMGEFCFGDKLEVLGDTGR